jgi:hypothetical protein
MDTAKQTKEAKIIVVDKELDKYKKQPLPQRKTDIALRNIGSALKAVQENKEQQQHKNIK